MLWNKSLIMDKFIFIFLNDVLIVKIAHIFMLLIKVKNQLQDTKKSVKQKLFARTDL